MARVTYIPMAVVWAYMCAVIYFAFTAPPALGFKVPDAARIIFFHVPAAITCVLFFAGGTWYALRVLIGKKALDDVKSVAAIEMGTLMCVLATVTGSIFAWVQWGSPWNWDPRETSIVAQLMIYAAYFALRASLPDARRRAVISAGYAVFAMVTVPFLIYILPRLPMWTSLHPNDTLTSSAGLDPTYKAIFWSAVLGYFVIGVLIIRLRIQAGALLTRLENAIGLAHSGDVAASHRLVGPGDLPGGHSDQGVPGDQGGGAKT